MPSLFFYLLQSSERWINIERPENSSVRIWGAWHVSLYGLGATSHLSQLCKKNNVMWYNENKLTFHCLAWNKTPIFTSLLFSFFLLVDVEPRRTNMRQAGNQRINSELFFRVLKKWRYESNTGSYEVKKISFDVSKIRTQGLFPVLFIIQTALIIWFPACYV